VWRGYIQEVKARCRLLAPDKNKDNNNNKEINENKNKRRRRRKEQEFCGCLQLVFLTGVTFCVL
jgi:hypothetical protein